VPPAAGSNRARDRLAGDHFGVLGVPVVVLHHGDREREHHPCRSEVGVDFDLSGCVALAQLVEDGVNVWLKSLVGLPRDSPRNDEISPGPPEVFSHTQ